MPLLKVVKQRDAQCSLCEWWLDIVDRVNQKSFYISDVLGYPIISKAKLATLFRFLFSLSSTKQLHTRTRCICLFPKWSHALSSYVTTVIHFKICIFAFFGTCHKNIGATLLKKNRGGSIIATEAQGEDWEKKSWWHLVLEKYLRKSRLCFHSNQLCWVHWALLKIKKRAGRKNQSKGCLVILS